MTYRNKLSPLYLEGPKDVVVDLWIGSSELGGIRAFTADLINPLEADATTPLTVSRIWDRWIDATYRLAGNTDPDSFGWDVTPLKSGSVANTTTFAYSSGLYHQTEKPIKSAAVDLDSTPYHHTVFLGISSSALNDNTAVVATKLAHWSPLVTGTETLTDTGTDMGALQHYIVNYLTPAIKNLQAAGNRVFIGALYVSISGDSLYLYSSDEANSWSMNMAMARREIEKTLGFVGIPTVILGVTQANASASAGADTQDLVRAQQQLYAEINADTTRYFDTRKYPTDDKIHFDAQATFDIGRDVTAFRYGSRLGLAQITKAL
jgi:hypothetical protein